MVSARRRRRTLSIWTVVAVLFMQLASAAYACHAPAPGASAVVGDAVGRPDCDVASPTAMDPDLPLLCKLHCAPDGQAVGAAGAGQAASPPMLLAGLDGSVAVPAVDLTERPSRWLPAGAAPPGAPPIYLSLLALRN